MLYFDLETSSAPVNTSLSVNKYIGPFVFKTWWTFYCEKCIDKQFYIIVNENNIS